MSLCVILALGQVHLLHTILILVCAEANTEHFFLAAPSGFRDLNSLTRD